MKKLGVVLLLVFVSVLSAADPALSIPEKIQTEAGLPVEIVAKTDGKIVKWFAVSGDEKRKCFIFTTKDNGSRAIFVAPKEGVYYVYAITASGDVPSDPALAVITVGATPGPIPNPPTPNPPVPTPELDEFQKALQALYTSNTETDKADSKLALAKLYRYMSTVDPVPATQGALRAVFITKAAEFKASGKLRPVQLKASEVIEKQMPGGPTTPVDKDKIKATFNYLADSMEKIK